MKLYRKVSSLKKKVQFKVNKFFLSKLSHHELASWIISISLNFIDNRIYLMVHVLSMTYSEYLIKWNHLAFHDEKLKIKKKSTHQVSKFENFFVTTFPKSMPSLSTILCARSGWDVPEKTLMFGIAIVSVCLLFRTEIKFQSQENFTIDKRSKRETGGDNFFFWI